MEGLAAESMSADLEQMKEQIRELMNMVTTMMSAQITENPAQTQQPQQAIPSQINTCWAWVFPGDWYYHGNTHPCTKSDFSCNTRSPRSQARLSRGKEDDKKVTNKLESLEEKIRGLQGIDAYGSVNFSDLCFFSDLKLPPKYKTPDFDKYNGSLSVHASPGLCKIRSWNDLANAFFLGTIERIGSPSQTPYAKKRYGKRLSEHLEGALLLTPDWAHYFQLRRVGDCRRKGRRWNSGKLIDIQALQSMFRNNNLELETSQRRPPARKQERVQKGEVKMITSTGPKRQAIYVQPMAPQPYFVPQNSQPGSQTGQAQPVTGGNALTPLHRTKNQGTRMLLPLMLLLPRATGSAATKDSESRSQSAESTESKDERDGGNVQKLGTRSNGGATTGYVWLYLSTGAEST
ncbi:hypothetical protein Acr_00g0001140 [Actinidia rufa]|uniref:Uncharacterized protein n=1 Tax=Actinidia rufa TaxID=165716 RepID=A0A7J0D6H3_9ERIC|nr:hypothetical protein Acr_00g0001140 [Actinidia rufa]